MPKKMNKYYKSFLLLSLVLPSTGIIMGIAIIIFCYTDMPGPTGPQRAERKSLHIGILCVILGIINIAILWLIISL